MGRGLSPCPLGGLRMRKRRKVILAFFIGIVFLLTFCRSDYKFDVQRYIKGKYHFDVDVLSTPTINTGNMGNSSFTVRRSDIPELIFSVNTKGFFVNKITGDNYEKVNKVYQLNQKYQDSEDYKALLAKGIHSFLSFYGMSKEEDHLGVSLVLMKKDALEINDSNFTDLYNGLQTMRTFIPNDYLAKELIILDAFDSSLNNVHSTYEKHGPLGYLSFGWELSEVTDPISFKKLLEKENAKSGEMVETHFYKKDFHLIKGIEADLNKLGFFVIKDRHFFPLVCDSTAETFDAINLDTCDQYRLSLEVKEQEYEEMLDHLSNKKVSQFYQSILLYKETGLHISTLIIAKENGSNNDFLYIKLDLNEMNSENDAREVLKKAIEEKN